MKRNLIKWLCLGAVLLLCTGLGIYFTWEHSLPPVGETITVARMEEGVTVEENTAFPRGETVSRTIFSTDGEFSALQEGLEALRYSHTRKSHTLPDTCYYISTGGVSLYLSQDGQIWINGEAYRADTEALCRLCSQLTR